MKKILLATTALAATTGVAAAEVTLSGYAEMGVAGGDGMDTQFHDVIDVSFRLTGTSDSGLIFGAKIDLDEADDGRFTGGDKQRNTVFISGDFGTLNLGDTDGAFDWAMSEVASGTSLTDNHTVHAGYSGNSGLDGVFDGQILRYDNSFGDFGFAASAELHDAGSGDVFGVGATYKLPLGPGDVTFGLGFQSGSVTEDDFAGLNPSDAGRLDADIVGVSISADLGNGFSATANYSRLGLEGSATEASGDRHSLSGDANHLGIGLTYALDALSLNVNYGEYDSKATLTEVPNGGVPDVAPGAVKLDGFGLVANYDLGGGAVAMFGYGDGDTGDTWSLGLGLSF